MLSAAHREIVKATVPLLETGGEALTRHFYESLLRDHPELGPLFNQANQRSGQQQRALANGVLMYAKNIDRMEALGDLVGAIVSKHVSLQVQPEHYPVVGAVLLRSIRTVLGPEVATDAVIEAWGAAYGQLAGILVGAEKAAYDTSAGQVGGWRGARPFTVVGRTMETGSVVSLLLEPADGGAVARHLPGQYIGLRLNIGGQEHRRNYSLSAAANGRNLRISVKQEPGGRVSTWLHRELALGDRLDIFPPAGAFVLHDGSRPVVLISGGIGVTPVMAMLEAVVASHPRRRITFIHAARNRDLHAFRNAVDAIAARHAQVDTFYCYDEHAGPGPAPDAIGRLDGPTLERCLPEDRDVDAYLLGPTEFMRQIRRALATAGVPAAQTRYEFFGPAQAID